MNELHEMRDIPVMFDNHLNQNVLKDLVGKCGSSRSSILSVRERTVEMTHSAMRIC